MAGIQQKTLCTKFLRARRNIVFIYLKTIRDHREIFRFVIWGLVTYEICYPGKIPLTILIDIGCLGAVWIATVAVLFSVNGRRGI